MLEGNCNSLITANKSSEKLSDMKDKPVMINKTARWRWVSASNGHVPPNAVIGGADGGENLYIARAEHNGSLVPGKLHPSHKCCYIPWGNSEHRKEDYEVLCNADGTFVQSDGSIPPYAIVGGASEVNDEPLYIGRVIYRGTCTIGKVQPSHGLCYIPYGGHEIAFDNYQIYVSQ